MTKKEFDTLQVGDIITAKFNRDMIANKNDGWQGEVISKEYPFIKVITIHPAFRKGKILERLKYTDYKISKKTARTRTNEI